MTVATYLGRPRVLPPGLPGSPRDQIIAAAARLFAERGYAHTSMSEIARAAGLQQSSLYYWFRRKELILQATFAMNRIPLDFINIVGARSGSPALKLYRFVRFDTRQLCLSPCDFNEIERLAELQPDLFADFWADRQRLHDWVVTLIKAAVQEGQFIDCDPDLVALGLLSTDEGVQKRFRHQDQHRLASTNPFTHPAYDPDRVAEFVATTAVRALLRRPADLTRIQRQAATYADV
jgi:AcrR family transcriptional regulator